MNLNSLQSQLNDSSQRRLDLLNALLSFSRWFNSSGLYSLEANSLVARAIDRLRNHTLQVACVGEFSRGKTELINALLFDQVNCRLLPSRPGRTTMCPTEISYDPNLPNNCIQLLPLVTRKSGTSVKAFKQIPEHWVSRQFDLSSPASVQDALGRIAERQFIPEEQARDLGFNCTHLNRHPQNIHEVEVPVWRHALINLDHPLLAKGLKIVDTPGLNASGTDPEVTANAIGDADSLIFCLAADAPASATDCATWRDYVNAEDNSSSLVVINKIDSLWDDLVSAPSEETTINSVRTETALALGLPLQQVVPVTAKRALIAKAKGDRALLKKSNFQQFEALLTARVNDSLKQLFKHADIEDALALIRQTHQLVQDRLLVQADVIGQLQAQDDPPEEALQAARDDIKDAHRRVHQVSILHRSYERPLNDCFKALTEIFGAKQIGRLLNYLHTAAADPEPVLRPAIKATLKHIQLNLSKLAIEAEQANRVLDNIYAEPVSGSGRLQLSSRHLTIAARQHKFSEFKYRCEQFLLSIEQSNVSNQPLARHFLLSLSQEVRAYADDTNALLEAWYQQALMPISYPNECNKQLLQKELLALSRGGENGDAKSNSQSMLALRVELTKNQDHLFNLNQLLERIDRYEPLAVPTDKVIPLSFARRRTS